MDAAPEGQPLRGRIAVVAGATRGAGRGIAAALGEVGATVVCTGRSSLLGGKVSDYNRPETIEETAALVDELGGHGVAIAVDHLEPAEVRALAHRLHGDYGGIDILVNDIWGAEVLKGPPATWNRPIWEHDLDDGLRILRLGVEVTDGTRAYNDANFRLSVFFDLAKTAVNRLAFAHGHELQAYSSVRRSGHRCSGGRRGPRAVESALGDIRGARARVRSHRHRRSATRRLGLRQRSRHFLECVDLAVPALFHEPGGLRRDHPQRALVRRHGRPVCDPKSRHPRRTRRRRDTGRPR